MKAAAILAIDQGTTGSRVILYNQNGKVLSSAYREHKQYFPKPGWVEHDPMEILRNLFAITREALQKARLVPTAIAAIGITNQRETSVIWNPKTGRPVYPAIVWQDRRTASMMDEMRGRGIEADIRRRTGLVLDPYFSASKIAWVLKHRSALRRQRLCFGTMDSWLLWQLTGEHKTDFTNASRTLLFNIQSKRWDPVLLKHFRIPESWLPQALPSASLFGKTRKAGPFAAGIPVQAILGDQQAALFGQSCYRKGEMKNTYGTGCFVVVNLGGRSVKTPSGVLQTIACDSEGKPVYALEGSIFMGGAVLQWLRDKMVFFAKAADSEAIARRAESKSGVVFVPAFVGLGSPYWNSQVRGMIAGLTRGTRREEITLAALESIAHQTDDVVELFKKYAGQTSRVLKVDGGATSNRFLMQYQADVLNREVWVSDIQESTAWGVAKLAGKSSGYWPDLSPLDRNRRYRKFRPEMKPTDRSSVRMRWKQAVRMLLNGNLSVSC